MSIINSTVQPFKIQALKNGKFVEVTEQNLRGQWSAFDFMPVAFTFNCPTEVEDAADNYAAFQKLETEIYIVTTDSHFAHKVWNETSPAVGKAKFPLVGDPTHQLTRMFGVHIDEDGMALRGTYLINPEGVVKTAEVHDNMHRPRHVRDIAQAQGRAVRCQEPRPGLPGQMERRRQDPDTVARPGGQDLSTARGPRRRAGLPALPTLPHRLD